MRVLLEECVPRGLRKHLPGHDISTVSECGRAGEKNGALMRLAAERFDVILTVDKALPRGRSRNGGSITLALIHANSNDIAALRPLAPAILAALARIGPGDIAHVP